MLGAVSLPLSAMTAFCTNEEEHMSQKWARKARPKLKYGSISPKTNKWKQLNADSAKHSLLWPSKEPDAEPDDFPETLCLFGIQVSNQLISLNKAERAARE